MIIYVSKFRLSDLQYLLIIDDIVTTEKCNNVLVNPNHIKFASINYKMYSEDQLTVKMINELYRLGNQIENKKKTIILYDLFENREEHAVQLNNLHVCSQVILDQDLNVKILKEEDEEGNTTNKYAITEEQKS